jgi:hypothetical protein
MSGAGGHFELTELVSSFSTKSTQSVMSKIYAAAAS